MQIPSSISFYKWKGEIQLRAEKGIYPLLGVEQNDIKEGLTRLSKNNCDLWASIWIGYGNNYLDKANEEMKKNKKNAQENYILAWRYFNLARWPALLSPQKNLAWEKAKYTLELYGKTLSPIAKTINIPFPGHAEIVGILRVPQSNPSTSSIPLLITIGGLDGWRDDMISRFNELPSQGIAVLAIDAPGTGDSSVSGASKDTDDMFYKLLHWAHKNFDTRNIYLHGGSFGGYWSSRIALTYPEMLAGAIDQSGPIDESFKKHGFLNQSGPLAPSFYLFDLEAGVAKMLNSKKPKDTEEKWHNMSLRDKGLLGKSSPPMLVIGGALDPLVPMNDLLDMMSGGKVPNIAWINPIGLHLGRTPGSIGDKEIELTVILPWLKQRIALNSALSH